ncbi:MAG: hypothetical protein WCG85_02355 [Polyangia bacterium]
MKRFAVEAKHLRAPLVAVEMGELLKERKADLEAQIRQRFADARENGTRASVTMLSATLRAVRAQLARAADG